MPLTVIRSSSNEALWAECRNRFLAEIGDERGPSGYPSHLWIAHSNQRDALFEEAVRRGLPGWLAPPVSFLSELRERFEVRARPVGHLTGRLLVARIAAREFRRAGLGSGRQDRGPAGSHSIDGLFSELLPEGVRPDDLRRALDGLGGDDFALARNQWVCQSYASFLSELEDLARFDPRSIHAIVADRIERGGLPAAIGDARTLHIYGLTSLQRRRRLVQALSGQGDVEVVLYLAVEPGASEWDDIVPGPARQILLDAVAPAGGVLHTAPNAVAEATWVAGRVKSVLLEGGVAPHEVAVVARSGGEDTRRIVEALREAGVPATARMRSTLAEVAALRAILLLFQGAAEDWTYRALRQVLTSPFFDLELDLRPFDFIAAERRVRGLEGWSNFLARLLDSAGSEQDAGRLARQGIYPERLGRDVPKFAEFRSAMSPLSEDRTEVEWIDLTLDILDGRRFDFRRRLSEAPSDRWDLVRADQRGTEALRVLLIEWKELRPGDGGFGPGEWHARLRRLLESNEIALTTPARRGVQVLEAHEAALTPFRHTFIVHTNDGVFPRPHLSRGVFSEDETSQLKAIGLPLSTRDDTLRRELALWASVTAQESLVFTCRSAAADGAPRVPSLLLPIDAGADAAGLRSSAQGPSGDADAEQVPVSRLQRLAREVTGLRQNVERGNQEPFESIDPSALRQAVLAAYAEELRSGGLDRPSAQGEELPASFRPHAWGGLLRDPVVADYLENRFGDDRIWSASQLEQYGRRPFDFLLDRVLRLQASGEVEEATTPASRGALAHEILDRFFKGVGDLHPSALAGDAADLFDRVAEETLREAEESEEQWLGEPALWRITREQVVEIVRSFLERELPRLDSQGAWPARVELEFGDDPDPEFRIDGRDLHGRSSSIKVRGRIDRVDAKAGKDGIELHVVDYKWKSYPARSGYWDGSVLQTPIYMRAAAVLANLEGVVTQGFYRPINGTTVTGARLLARDADTPLDFALSIPPRIRAGLFEPVQAKATQDQAVATRSRDHAHGRRHPRGSPVRPFAGGPGRWLRPGLRSSTRRLPRPAISFWRPTPVPERRLRWWARSCGGSDFRSRMRRMARCPAATIRARSTGSQRLRLPKRQPRTCVASSARRWPDTASDRGRSTARSSGRFTDSAARSSASMRSDSTSIHRTGSWTPGRLRFDWARSCGRRCSTRSRQRNGTSWSC